MLILLLFALFASASRVRAQVSTGSRPQPAELAYKVIPDFLKLPSNLYFSEVSGVAVNSTGHVFVFQRGLHPLVEFDENGNFVRSFGEGLFSRPHGLRIDSGDNIWVTDNGAHFLLKLSPDGRIIMVLGQRDYPGNDHAHFNGPDDVAFGKSGEIYVADGEGNSRIVEFDRDGHFLREWGQKGSSEGEFQLPHTIATDAQGLVYVGDRENGRIQVFDPEGKFLTQWRDIGHPYGLFVSPDQHIWMADAVASRVVEMDRGGRVLGGFGMGGRGSGQFAGAHALAVSAKREVFVAEVFNWRVEKFVPSEGQAPLAAPRHSPSTDTVHSQLSPELQRLSDAFAGSWNVTETFEVSASQQGKTRRGTASFRLGPGASLIEDYHSNGSAGELKFLALLWWDQSAHGYRLLTCANNDGCHLRGTANWEGKEFVNSWEEKVDGKTAVFKDSFVDISPSSFRLVSEGTADGRTIWRVITKYERQEEGVFVTIPSGHSVTIDGKVTAGEWEDAQSIPISFRNDWNIRVRFKHDQEYLYLLFHGVTHGGESLFPEVFVDPEYRRTAHWQKGQWWFHVSYNLCEGNGEPNVYTKGGVFQCAREKEGWAGNNPPSKDTQATEIKVSFSKLGVKPEAGHQLGLAFALTNATGDATQKWFFWPRSAEVQAPNTWGQAVLQ